MHRKIDKLTCELRLLKWAVIALALTFICLEIIRIVSAEGSAATTTGNVATNLSIRGNDAATNRADSGSDAEILKMASRRGYFTASEYAKYRHLSLETIYRKINDHTIEGASKVNGHWHIPLP